MKLTEYQKRSVAWLLIAVLFGWALWALGPVLMPFLVAAVLAYALNPLVNRLHNGMRGKMPRWVSVSVVVVVFLLAVASLLMLMIPVVMRELPVLREQIPLLMDGGSAWIQSVLDKFDVPFKVNIASVKALVLGALKDMGGVSSSTANSVLSSLMIGGSAALALCGVLVLIGMVWFYLLLDWDRMVDGFFKMVPKRYRDSANSFAQESDEMLGQYLRGQLLVMLVLAVYYSVGLLLFGFDLGLPIGLFTGLAVFVPYLGFGVGLIMAFLFGVLQLGLTKAVIMVAVVYGVGQVIESFFLTPRLVGERIGMPPLVVIFALLAFGQLFGFVGILVALPCSAVLMVAGRRLRLQYLNSSLYND